MMRFLVATLTCMVCFGLVGWYLWLHFPREASVNIGTYTIEARIATTPQQLTAGLSDTPNLAPNHGMLFVMSRPSRWQFWMKDMHYNLDIIWLNTHKSVVYIAPNLSPSTFPKTYAPPQSNTLYVLEVPAGTAQQHHITIGTQVHFAL